MLKILVISGTLDGPSKVIDSLGKEAEVTAVSRENKAISNLRNNKFDLVIFGDSLEQGDLYGVALEFKTLRTNRRVPVVVISHSPAVRTRLREAMRPYAFEVEEDDPGKYVPRIEQAMETYNKLKQ